MSDNANPPAGDQTNAGGTGKNDNDNQKPNNVEALARKNAELLAEKKKISERLKAFEDAEAKRAEDDAKKRGDYEALLKSKEEEAAKAREESSRLKAQMTDAKKLGAVVDAAGQAIDRKWLSMIDVDSVLINPDTGEIDQMSVTKTVEDFKKTWPEAFIKPGRSLPNEAPNGGLQMIAESAWLKLPRKEMDKFKRTQIDWGK